MPRSHNPEPSAGTTLSAIGDWNDVRAAVLAAASRHELAILNQHEHPDRMSCELISILDEQIMFNALRDPAQDDWPGPISLMCRIGESGDGEREREFLESVAHRLEQLAGRDATPVRW